jgi:hypothetical protein
VFLAPVSDCSISTGVCRFTSLLSPLSFLLRSAFISFDLHEDRMFLEVCCSRKLKVAGPRAVRRASQAGCGVQVGDYRECSDIIGYRYHVILFAVVGHSL